MVRKIFPPCSIYGNSKFASWLALLKKKYWKIQLLKNPLNHPNSMPTIESSVKFAIGKHAIKE